MASQHHITKIYSDALKCGKKCLSFELFLTEHANAVLVQPILNDFNASYLSYTWHHGDLARPETLFSFIVGKMLIDAGYQSLMHINSKRFTSKDQARTVINAVKEIGTRNVLALSGAGDLEPDFKSELPYALDLVKFLREEYGDYFNIGVSGYPIGHPTSADPAKDIIFVKQKVDAGADFVLCQAVFDLETFKIFYKRCRDIGIEVPIIPGVYTLNSNPMVLARVKGFCKVIPEKYTNFFQEHAEDDEAINEFSAQWTKDLIECLLNCKEIEIPGVHIFCLCNFELVKKVVDSLDFDKLSLIKPQM